MIGIRFSPVLGRGSFFVGRRIVYTLLAAGP